MAAEEVLEFPGEGVLLGVLRALPYHQLRALPPIRVPRVVLDAMTDSDKYEALCELDDQVPACGYAEPAGTANEREIEAASALVEQFDVATIGELRERLRRAGVATGAGGSARSGHRSLELLDDPDSTRELAEDAEAAAAALVAVREMLAKLPAREGEADGAIRAAQRRADQLIEPIQSMLADYHAFRVRVLEGRMQARRADCELEARRYRDLDEQAASIRDQLARRSGLLRRGPSQSERERLQARLKRIKQRLAREHTFIEEAELSSWFDVLVNASLHMRANEWREDARGARFLLYQLLNVHCMQTLVRSDRRAVDMLLRPDGHEKLVHCPAARQYIGKYLAYRRTSDAARDRETARGREPFLRARETMLAEYPKGQ